MTLVRTDTSWDDAAPQKGDYPAFAKDESADVAVIGGGLTGMLSAYLLAKQGKSVIVLEKGKLGYGATGDTTAMLTESIDTDATDLITAFGKADARTLIGAHHEAIGLVKKIIDDEHIDCDFIRVPNYIYANEAKQFADIREQCEALKELGVNVELQQDGSALGFRNHGYCAFQDQAVFHPLKFLYQLARILAEKYGVHIYEQTATTEAVRDGAGMKVMANGHAITAAWVVSATYEPFHEPLRLYFKKGMYVSYMFEAFVKGIELAEGSYEDTESPYHFGRIEKREGGYRFIIGGEDHRYDLHVDANRNWNALKEYLDTIIPPDSYEIVRKWRGPILEPVDGVPLIGRLNDDPILYASAFSGNGMTYAGIAADLIAHHIAGTPREERERLYAPNRFLHLASAALKAVDYVEELAGGAIKNTLTESSKPDPKTV